MKVLVTAVTPDVRQWRGLGEGYCLNVDPSENPSTLSFDSVLLIRWGIRTDKEAKALLAEVVSGRDLVFADIDPKEFLSVHETGLLTDFLLRVRDNLVHEAQSIYDHTPDHTL